MLKDLGYTGSERTAERYVREKRLPPAYLPLAFGPREAAQYDWGEVYVAGDRMAGCRRSERWEDFHVDRIRDFLAYLRDERGNDGRSIALKLAAVKSSPFGARWCECATAHWRVTLVMRKEMERSARSTPSWRQRPFGRPE